MAGFIEALGRPDQAYPIIHIAGTNGKGSTAAMLEQIFRSAGYKTGLFTSPHLVYLGERIQVNRVPISRETITALTNELDLHAKAVARDDEEKHPTFFEFMAAMALLHFQREQVDIVILETGLGGRLDATNVVDPLVSVITSIGLDHVNILGDTVEKIAFEKAGIIKQNRPVVMGRMPEASAAVIAQVASRKAAQLFSVEQAYGENLENYPCTNLFGTFQRWNAATAVLTCELLKDRFPGIMEAASTALQNVDWPGRWQSMELPCGRRLILDATHNPEGSYFLDENLGCLEEELGQKPWIVAGTLGEFRAQYLMPVAARHARGLFLLKPDQPRSASFEDLRKWLPSGSDFPVVDADKVTLFPEAGCCAIGEPGDTIVVTGSIYLLGEVIERLSGQEVETGAALQDLP
ncbi:MAG: bifunctional folylpolyglutamate synthase/dihydrofolate synthase [Verrucomicrobiae bacterium]|nr:bifunctional folylpolyglutamate synthase/dihydrofolate synthase [Verrucomicrobiae bacterium]